ncbi:CBS domain-containing protein [Polyangium aurulentum]|uniref:CBS domain-containing protein n=1 Tax=Polyangium aurulentum TaxID=2567896 RepID=UPI0010AE13B9|nr:CBS domain-containing protein [Polyangium aurulentum]UQA58071.1 CBS domain-containing protein [Polyangium aurulentum]
MSLDRYRRPRLIVLQPSSSAYEAARAMADNHVGSVLVGQDGHIAGIVTDRDLALDVVATDYDPRSTFLRSVMSDEVAFVDVDATVDDVIQVMREHACRRVPVTDNGKPVGIVTLDDLILGGFIEIDDVREIIRAQLEVSARLKEPGTTGPTQISDGRARARQRRIARAENTYGRLLHAVERQTGLDTREHAERALLIVLGNICRRLLPQEARHLIAQLPSKLHPDLEACLDGPDKRITSETIEGDLRQALHMTPEAAADVLYAVCEAVADSVSAGEIESVRDQLPRAMKELFPTMPGYRKAG